MGDRKQAPISIASVQIENVKRVKAFALYPAPEGLTIIGGGNGEGKTTILDSIAWALGGGRKAPSKAKRDGSMSDPHIKVTLSNGIVVERKGKNSTLTVVDPTGVRSGQALLDSVVSEFALDLPKFLEANDKDKASTLLQTLGIGDKLDDIDRREQALYAERHAVGQTRTKMANHAESMPEFPNAPTEPVSISDLLKEQQAVLARNAENQRLRNAAERCARDLQDANNLVERLKAELARAEEVLNNANYELELATKSAESLEDETTSALEAQILNFEAINQQVAANQAKQHAIDEAEVYAKEYEHLGVQINAVRQERIDLLNGANLPLPGLSVEEGNLLYNGQRWDCMSGSEQLRVAVAIVQQLKPDCRFVLVDKLEQMDMDTLQEFGAWLNEQGLQAIATRVSTGDECSIVIEDGLPAGMNYSDVVLGANNTELSEPIEF